MKRSVKDALAAYWERFKGKPEALRVALGEPIQRGRPQLSREDRMKVIDFRLSYREDQLKQSQQRGDLYDPLLREYVQDIDFLLGEVARFKGRAGDCE